MSSLGTDRIARVAAGMLRIRWLVRAPIWLYRARLGVVFGSRLLMLEQVGRSSGQLRYVVLEIVDHPTEHRYVVVSGMGERAQWFRNIRADPQVRISIASARPEHATASTLDAADAAASLRSYALKHPRAWARLRPVLEQTLGSRIDDTGTTLPMIALDVDDR